MSRLNIQFTLFSAFYSPLISAMSGGFLKEEGIDYNWSVSPPGKSAVESITNGSADVIQTALIQGLLDLEKGHVPEAINFAQINEMDGFFISAREPDDRFDWRSLEGSEMVMFGGGQPNYMFRYACHKAGIDYDKIIPITPGGPADIDKAYRAGQGKYVQQQGPFPQQLEADGIGNVVASVGPKIGACAFSSLAASREWIETDQARAFMRAYRKTRIYLNQESAVEIARAQKSFFPDIELDALTACIHSYQKLGCWTPHAEITQAAYEVTLDVFSHAGVVNTRHPYNAVCCLPPDTE